MRARLALVISLSVLATLVACGNSDGDGALNGSGDGSGDGAGDAGFDGAGGDDGGIDLPACVDNLDCRGGEVCRDGLCREACGDEDPCSGPLPVCHPTLGICVECVLTADCAGGEVCFDGACIDACASDDDCAGGQTCDRATGACIDVDCVDDGDCRGGEACRGGACVPIDDQVCDPDEARCDGNTLVGCTRDGTAETSDECGGDALCVENGTTAECVTFVCDANEVGCSDNTTAFVCNATGTARDEFPCPAGQLCSDGVCRRQVCEPESATCEGDTLLLCDALGASQAAIACSSLPECADSALGCACDAGSCEPRVCNPGSSQCVGSGYRQCDDQGLSIGSVVPCGGDEFCQAGACVSSTCSSGETRCAGETRLTCNASETGWTETDCAARGAWCDTSGGGAVCTPRVCTPGTRGCTSDRSATVVCNSRGSEQVTTDCGGDEYCSGGACLAQVCDPGSRTCIDGDVYRCDLAGSAYGYERSCAAGELCDAGVCVESSAECVTGADCPPPTASCSAADVLTYYSGNGRCIAGACNYGTVQRTVDCGAAGQECNATTASCTSTPTGCTGDAGCPDGVCIGGVCRDCRTTADCSPDETCRSNACIGLDPTDCTSDAQCIAMAADMGFPDANAACDAEVGCFIYGDCNGASGGDPWDAPCPAGLTCGLVFELTIELGSACKGCESDADCRGDEVCQSPLFPFPDGTPYCAAPGGGGLPFP